MKIKYKTFKNKTNEELWKQNMKLNTFWSRSRILTIKVKSAGADF